MVGRVLVVSDVFGDDQHWGRTLAVTDWRHRRSRANIADLSRRFSVVGVVMMPIWFWCRCGSVHPSVCWLCYPRLTPNWQINFRVEKMSPVNSSSKGKFLWWWWCRWCWWCQCQCRHWWWWGCEEKVGRGWRGVCPASPSQLSPSNWFRRRK